MSERNVTSATDTRTGDEMLVELVRGYPHLYDKRNKDFKDKVMKTNSWTEIGTLLNVTEEECQNRSLRDRFSRELRENIPKSGQAAKKRKPWDLLDTMMFLKDHIKPKKTFGNLPISSQEDVSENEALEVEVEEEQDTIGPISPFTPLNPLKRRRVEEESLQNNILATMQLASSSLRDTEQNEFILFGRSVGENLKNINSKRAANMAQIEILQVLNKYLDD